MQALAALKKVGPADFMEKPAILATHLALLEATEDLQGAKRLAESSLKAADTPAQSARGKPAKSQAAAAKALLYQTLARAQLKVWAACIHSVRATVGKHWCHMRLTLKMHTSSFACCG